MLDGDGCLLLALGPAALAVAAVGAAVAAAQGPEGAVAGEAVAGAARGPAPVQAHGVELALVLALVCGGITKPFWFFLPFFSFVCILCILYARVCSRLCWWLVFPALFHALFPRQKDKTYSKAPILSGFSLATKAQKQLFRHIPVNKMLIQLSWIFLCPRGFLEASLSHLGCQKTGA